MEFRNGVFIITEENNCPLYHVSEEFRISEGILTLPTGKQTCLTLMRELIDLTASSASYEKFTSSGSKKTQFDCGGCTGRIHFEYKTIKGYSTLQMTLLAAAERRGKIQGVNYFADLLRTIELFSSLSDDELLDLATLLELEEYPWQFPITQKGDPGNRLFILVDGKAEVIDDSGIAQAELGIGEVFGEMSLLSGDRVSMTVMAAEPCKVAIMSQKNFHHIIARFPVLQVFFYKLLVSRITTMNTQRSEELASGMVGQLSDVSSVEICQMINASRKTGRLRFELADRSAHILFLEGELVHADVDDAKGNEAFFQILAVEDGR